MKRRFGAILRLLGGAYLIVLLMLFHYGYVVLGLEEGIWTALGRYQEEWGPFAIFDHLVRLVLASPGIALYMIGNRLRCE